MIEALNIFKKFDGQQILSDVSVSFEPGMTNLIIGESGSGKQVWMKCLVGLHEVDSGSSMFNDRNFTRMSHAERKVLRKEMGMLFQGSALFDSMTVLENVIFPLTMFSGLSYFQRRKRAMECLDRVHLPNTSKLYPAELSGGMKKRVAIARAIAIKPKFLFCDEPNSGLDPKTAIVIDKLIAEITHEYRMTTIVNTHDMNSVIGIGDKINFIHQGKLWWQGDRSTILNTENQEVKEFIYANEILKHFRGGSDQDLSSN